VAEFSFDVGSEFNAAELTNALDQARREVGTRYDFKDSKSSITRQEGSLLILADDELKLRQLHELLKVHLTRRKVDAGALEFKPAEKASGNMQRQTVVLKQGIDRELAKRLVREIKDSGLKVQASVQGEELRVSGKKRDDLQGAITVLRGLKIEQPLQYVNFRD